MATTFYYSGAPVFDAKFRVVELYFGVEFAQLSIIQWMIQRETIVMNTDQTVRLINLLSKKRAESGLSVAEVARRSHVDVGTVWRIEQGMIATPKAESLKAIGTVLGIPPIDLFVIVGWISSGELPSLSTYLCAKYDAQLPAEAVSDVESHIEAVVDQYGSRRDDEANGSDHSRDNVSEQHSESPHSPQGRE
jgi:transcriptional regulator with XRE-family HTH domain